jgi:hypothetical protein
MSSEIEILERAGLVRDEDSLAVEDFAEKKAASIFEKLYSCILERQPNP